MTFEKYFEEGYNPRKFELGDLVEFAGIYYFIEGYQITLSVLFDKEELEVLYDLTAAFSVGTNADFIMGYQEDINYITSFDQADEYLKNVDGTKQRQILAQGITAKDLEEAVNSLELIFDDKGKKKKNKDEDQPRQESEADKEIKRRETYREKSKENLDRYREAKSKGNTKEADDIMRQMKYDGLTHEIQTVIYNNGGRFGERCDKCKGLGFVRKKDGFQQFDEQCKKCHGEGMI